MTTGLLLAATALIALIVPATTAAARSYGYATEYCARDYDGAMDCSYFTLRQCRQAVSATGGDCAVNPRYSGGPAPRYRRAPRNR
jgi:predicted carbohydrate-binding protein with CBM5 and CBM33 domain